MNSIDIDVELYIYFDCYFVLLVFIGASFETSHSGWFWLLSAFTTAPILYALLFDFDKTEHKKTLWSICGFLSLHFIVFHIVNKKSRNN
jgi:hypothetical protein